jgi:hypothetical protein
LLEPDRFLHLLVLELHELVVGIAVTMVFHEEIECLLLATLGEEESRGLGQELDADEDVNGQGELEHVRNPPTPA